MVLWFFDETRFFCFGISISENLHWPRVYIYRKFFDCIQLLAASVKIRPAFERNYTAKMYCSDSVRFFKCIKAAVVNYFYASFFFLRSMNDLYFQNVPVYSKYSAVFG